MSPDDPGAPSGASLSYRNILEREMENALREIDRPAAGVFISGFPAGLNLSFGALFMAMALTFAGGFGSKLLQQAVLDDRASPRDLGRLWALTYASNLLGCVAFAGLIATVGPAMGIVDVEALATLAGALTPLPWWVVLASGAVAGWLMGLATWLSAASRDTVGRIAFVLIVTSTIGLAPFHHIVLGTTELLSAMFAGAGGGLWNFGHFLLWTTVGNVVGGSVFVGLLNYGHVALAGEEQDVEFDAADGG